MNFLGRLKRTRVTELCKLAFKYKSDKTDLYRIKNKKQPCHNYTPYYYDILKDYKNSFCNILEIGIGIIDYNNMQHMKDFNYQPGASLKMWRDYFPKATIHGIYINKDSLLDKEERIKTYLCDQTDEVALNNIFSQIKFDLILDDGSHIPEHQLISLNILINKLNETGFYIIEDVEKKLFDDYFLKSVLGSTDILNRIEIKEYNLRKKKFGADNFFYLITPKKVEIEFNNDKRS